MVEGRSETVGTASGKRQQTGETTVAVNSAEFLQGGEEAVPEHERYLYRYFSQRAEEKRKKEEEEEGSDAGSISDTEFDDFLDKHERQLDHDDLGDLDFGLDFAGNIRGEKKGKRGKAAKADSSDDEEMGEEDDDDDDDDDDDGDDVGGLSDEEIDFGDDEDDELAAEFRREMEALGDVEDGEEGGDEEDELSGDELKQMMGGRKRSAQDEPGAKKPKKKSRKSGLASMFASADDFADVLESNADTGLTLAGTGDAVLVNDKTSAKQIAWEMKRGRQSGGSRNWKDKKHRGGKFAKGNKRNKKKM
ncbi:uncharacterized protein LOC143296300 [Babylonia areolata]|uniref:uncharacterized protein LOC143296300 n=1 Tax=Babylonia areolata TaxID=304850 RepID=UPI003FD54A5C